MTKRRIRRTIVMLVAALIVAGVSYVQSLQTTPTEAVEPAPEVRTEPPAADVVLARDVLAQLAVKGRAPKTGYSRSQFGDGWATVGGCDTRNVILYRDLQNATRDERCKVLNGTLQDPYTAKSIDFLRGPDTSPLVQIDHVVALSDAWQKGAQQLTAEQRIALANDPLELLAVDGEANNQKGAGDAATWLPEHKAFRCQYVARQIAVKQKYSLWVTPAERDAMNRVLQTCPNQAIPRAQNGMIQ